MNINGTGNNAERNADVIGKLGGGSGVGAASLLSVPVPVPPELPESDRSAWLSQLDGE